MNFIVFLIDLHFDYIDHETIKFFTQDRIRYNYILFYHICFIYILLEIRIMYSDDSVFK